MSSRSRIFTLALRYSIMAIVSLLLVEFLLGMWVNLYAALPVGLKVGLSQQPDFSGKSELGVHLILGIVLGILSIVALIFAALSKKVVSAVLALVGAVSIIAAAFSGLDFTSSGYTNNTESYVMSVTFLIAILIYLNLGRLVSIPSGKLPAHIATEAESG